MITALTRDPFGSLRVDTNITLTISNEAAGGYTSRASAPFIVDGTTRLSHGAKNNEVQFTRRQRLDDPYKYFRRLPWRYLFQGVRRRTIRPELPQY